MHIDPGRVISLARPQMRMVIPFQLPFLPDVQVVCFLMNSHIHCHSVNPQNWLGQTWIATFLDLFSIPGLYAHIIHATAFPWESYTRTIPLHDQQSLVSASLRVDPRNQDSVGGSHCGLPGRLGQVLSYSTGSILTDGSWDAWPTNFEAVEREMLESYPTLTLTFTYPPAPWVLTLKVGWPLPKSLLKLMLSFNLNQIIKVHPLKRNWRMFPPMHWLSGVINWYMIIYCSGYGPIIKSYVMDTSSWLVWVSHFLQIWSHYGPPRGESVMDNIYPFTLLLNTHFYLCPPHIHISWDIPLPSYMYFLYTLMELPQCGWILSLHPPYALPSNQ